MTMIPRKHTSARLGELSLFGACTSRELRRIETFCVRVDVPEHRLLCRQGEVGRQCFVVVDGCADVSLDGAPAATVGAGELVGEIALLARPGFRTATVTAATRMTLLVFTPPEFARLLSEVPTVRHTVLRRATRRLVENAARRTAGSRPVGLDGVRSPVDHVA